MFARTVAGVLNADQFGQKQNGVPAFLLKSGRRQPSGDSFHMISTI